MSSRFRCAISGKIATRFNTRLAIATARGRRGFVA